MFLKPGDECAAIRRPRPLKETVSAKAMTGSRLQARNTECLRNAVGIVAIWPAYGEPLRPRQAYGAEDRLVHCFE
jgi:hypothetical protein